MTGGSWFGVFLIVSIITFVVFSTWISGVIDKSENNKDVRKSAYISNQQLSNRIEPTSTVLEVIRQYNEITKKGSQR